MAKLISTALFLVALIVAGICVTTPTVDAAGFCNKTLYKTHKCHLGHCRLQCYREYDSYGANCIHGKKGALDQCICVHNKC
ncbi:unnamed protein product [Rhodiola kirilowii]